jgi:hypothetical protein
MWRESSAHSHHLLLWNGGDIRMLRLLALKDQLNRCSKPAHPRPVVRSIFTAYPERRVQEMRSARIDLLRTHSQNTKKQPRNRQELSVPLADDVGRDGV